MTGANDGHGDEVEDGPPDPPVGNLGRDPRNPEDDTARLPHASNGERHATPWGNRWDCVGSFSRTFPSA
jgi:hypothetical protein